MSPLEHAKSVFELEIKSLEHTQSILDESFTRLIDQLSTTSGRVIITGVGKSGLIGKKIAATLASTGTSSFFLHPTEALHGDLGMVLPDDAIIALSNSGETSELLKILPFFKDQGNLVIAITGNTQSTLAIAANYVLDAYVEEEACPLNLAPTSSTTVALVLGDALAVALMRAKNFSEKDFARFHPGGSLGKRLLHRVEDEMVAKELPCIKADTLGSDAVSAISSGMLGLVCIVDDRGVVVGVVTDGDLRRGIEKYRSAFFDTKVSDFMTYNPAAISADAMVSDAWQLMDDKKITSLVVVDHQGKLRGILKK